MSWITENPWPLILLLAGASIVSLILGDSRARSIALVFAIGAIGVYFLESAILTPGEQIELSLESLLKGFESEDLTLINSHIDDGSPGLKDKAKQGLELVKLDDGFHMQDIVVKVNNDGRSAETELRANGSLLVRQTNTPYHAATRWRTSWILHQEGWRLSEVHRLNPVTGDEIGFLDAQ